MSRNYHAGAARPLWVSQNFLTSSRLVEHLLSLTSIDEKDHVLEIGPGKGHITARLLTRCSHVTAVELDASLYTGLKQKYDGVENLSLVHSDILQWPLPQDSAYKVVSNLPFGSTTAILRRLTEARHAPSELWLVMERGAALRFCGQPRESLRSLVLKARYDIRIIHRLHRADFHPMPSVDAVFVHLKRKQQPDISDDLFASYQRFLERGFNGGLSVLRRQYGGTGFDEALRQARIATGRLPGDIRYIQWLCLFRCCHMQRRRP